MARETFTYDGKRYDITAADDKALAVKIAMLKKALDDGTVIVSKNAKLDLTAE